MGGELQVVQMSDTELAFDLISKDQLPADKIETVSYLSAGYAIFMQGCKIVHRVAPVQQAREPRISFVNSYMTRDVFAPDRTRYSTFKYDPPHITQLEYARHKSWRSKGILDALISEQQWTDDPNVLASLIDKAIQELTYARDSLTGSITEDRFGYGDGIDDQ